MHEKLHWALVLHRASRSADRRGMRRAVQAWPLLTKFCGEQEVGSGDLSGNPGSVRDVQGLDECITNLQNGAMDAEHAEIESDEKLAEEVKMDLLAKVRSRRMLWARKRRKVITVGVLREDG